VLAALGELPAAGATVQIPGYTIAVTELDGRRIARLRVTPVPGPKPAEPGEPNLAGDSLKGTQAE